MTELGVAAFGKTQDDLFVWFIWRRNKNGKHERALRHRCDDLVLGTTCVLHQDTQEIDTLRRDTESPHHPKRTAIKDPNGFLRLLVMLAPKQVNTQCLNQI